MRWENSGFNFTISFDLTLPGYILSCLLFLLLVGDKLQTSLKVYAFRCIISPVLDRILMTFVPLCCPEKWTVSMINCDNIFLFLCAIEVWKASVWPSAGYRHLEFCSSALVLQQANWTLLNICFFIIYICNSLLVQCVCLAFVCMCARVGPILPSSITIPYYYYHVWDIGNCHDLLTVSLLALFV